MKRILWILLFTCFLLLLSIWTYEELQDSFYESSIHLSTWPKTKYGPLTCKYSVNETRKILQQPFSYLGKGRQFFVFASNDGEYVLKFVKCQRIDVSSLYKHFPVPSFLDNKRKACLEHKQARIDGIFASCCIAAQDLPENTGVVFAHLNTNNELGINVELKDKLGFGHTIGIDDVPFILQKRALLIFPTLSKLLEHNDKAGLNARFDQLINLIVSDAKAGIYDTDSGTIMRDNVAFLHDSAIHVDIGTFVHQPGTWTKSHLKEQLSRLDPLVEWLEVQDPNLASLLQSKIEAAFQVFEVM